jgi:predicted dehydrogenase
VYVAAPNSAHAALVKEALAAGKHVLCEKPVTRSGTVADELCDYARAQGLVLWEGMHYRRHPAVLEAVSTLRAGAVGRPRRVDVFYGWPLDRPEDIRWAPDLHGGALMDVGCYGLDLAAWILDEPLTVSDVEWTPSPSGVDREADRGVDSTAVVRLAGATTEAVIGASLTSPELICRATVFGDGGHAVLERPCLPVLPDGERRCAFEMVVNGERPGRAGDPTTSYYYQLHAFGRAIRGAREPLVDPDLSGRAWLLQQAWQRIGGAEAGRSALTGRHTRARVGEGVNEQSM